MERVFVVQHSRTVADSEDVKFIGVYSSMANARAAVERAATLPGFCDAPDGFSIDPYDLDADHWTEGFITMTTIHVRLLDEGVEAWRPVVAQVVEPGVYEIQGPVPDGEQWEFGPGSIVMCEMRELSGAPVEVVVQEISDAR